MRCTLRRLTIMAALAPALLALPVQGAAAPTKEVPEKDRAKLETSLQEVFDLLPVPLKAFRRDKDGDDRDIASKTPPRTEDGAWRFPAGARATRVFTRASDDGESLGLEITVYVNLEKSLSDPLGSAGGSMRIDMLEEAPIARHSLASIDESQVGLPLDKTQRDNALTVVRAYVATPEATPYLSDLAQGRRPAQDPWAGANPKRPSEIRTIVVEYHGPAAEVDRLAAATPVAKLRKLLTP